jgi:hypothetical protein
MSSDLMLGQPEGHPQAAPKAVVKSCKLDAGHLSNRCSRI